ncbi:hypothetical protein ABWI00_09665 [Algihabitans albus]|uniref:hypothetical protein n=1 Tax=Algihabitans albus TaxID=2164067 RepID=UPI0035CF679D
MSGRSALRLRPLSPHWWPALALISVAVSIGLVAGIWTAIPQGLVTGTDGRLLRGLAREAATFGNFFDTTNYNPLQEGFDVALAFNHLLSVSMPFLFFEPPYAKFLTSLYALILYVVGILLFARAVGIKWLAIPAAVALPCALQIYPFQYEFGFSNQFLIMPGHFLTVSVFTIILAIIYTAGNSLRSMALRYIIVLLLLLWAILAEPLFSSLNVLFFLPLGLGVLLTKGRKIPHHVAFLALIVVVLWVLGPLEYLYSTLYGNARTMLDHEFSRGGFANGASSVFGSKFALYLHAFVLTSLAVGVFSTRSPFRYLAGIALVALLGFYSMAAVFLLNNSAWSLPLPIYFENATIHLFVIVALMSCQVHLEDLLSDRRVQHVRQILSSGAGALVAAGVPALLLFYWSDVAPRRTAIYVDGYAEARELADAIVEVRGKDRSGSGMARGAVAIFNRGYTAVPEYPQVLTHLWAENVPSMNHYSQLLTPPSHILVSRLAFYAREGVYPTLNRLNISNYDRNLFLLYGVRIVVSSSPLNDESLVLERELRFGRDGRYQAFIYSISGFTTPLIPTSSQSVEDLADVISVMRSGDFDVRREALLQDIPGPTENGAVEVVMELKRNRIHLRFAGSGESVVVLPVIFSHCWRVEDGEPSLRLARANGGFLAVLPAGAESATLSSDFSVWTPGCRRRDIADWKADIAAVSETYPMVAGRPDSPDSSWPERLRHVLMRSKWY